MSCYAPYLLGVDYTAPVNPETGKRPYHFIAPYTPELVNKYDSDSVVKVPCGKCLGCKLDYARHWADRMILELASARGKGIFATLTYNEDHLPEDGQLCKKDLQDFFKRLRNDFPPGQIRYYASGEYGKITFRPHYHCIIFGISLEDFDDRKFYKKNKLGQDYYTSEKFSRRWSDGRGSIGFVCLSDVSYKTCAYVARYTAKKTFGSPVPGKQVDEFAVMSRRPGIGALFLEQYGIEAFDRKHFYVSDQSGSVAVSNPSYFLKKLKLEYPVEYDMMMSLRRDFSKDKELLKLKRSDLAFEDQLKLDYERFINKTEILFNEEEVF